MTRGVARAPRIPRHELATPCYRAVKRSGIILASVNHCGNFDAIRYLIDHDKVGVDHYLPCAGNPPCLMEERVLGNRGNSRFESTAKSQSRLGITFCNVADHFQQIGNSAVVPMDWQTHASSPPRRLLASLMMVSTLAMT